MMAGITSTNLFKSTTATVTTSNILVLLFRRPVTSCCYSKKRISKIVSSREYAQSLNSHIMLPLSTISTIPVHNTVLSLYCTRWLVPVTCTVHIDGCFNNKRNYSKEVKTTKDQHEHGSVITQVFSKEQPKAVTVGAKVVQAGQDFTYLLAILAGFGLMGFLFYSVGSEFFSSTSPSSIFTKALKRVRADDRVKEVLGEPITGHGEESGRGRRRHLNYLEYEVEGVTYMRMKFYVSGSKRKGEAVLDLKKNGAGKFELRFLFVELIGYPPMTIILEDNR